MTDSLATFRERFPEFSDLDDGRVRPMLEAAKEIHSLSIAATLYLAAHLITLDLKERAIGVDEGAGVVISESIGPKKVTYKTQAEREGEVFFARTPYGRMFLTLRRPATAFSVRVI